ncbi:MAG: outer membrane beta-barrel protein, partial [Nitrospirota bacterium]|nr:outer membrane beta-barrel protein [Nitrospirota bacterium]
MKNRAVQLLLVVLLLMLPVISSAEIKEGSFEINPFTGLYIPNDSTGFHKSEVYGLRLGYNITPNWGVEGAFDWAQEQAQFYHADVLYHFTPERSFVPYMVAGLGAGHLDPTTGGSVDRFMGDIGIGFKYFLTNHIAFRADARNMFVWSDTYPAHPVVTAGLTFA